MKTIAIALLLWVVGCGGSQSSNNEAQAGPGDEATNESTEASGAEDGATATTDEPAPVEEDPAAVGEGMAQGPEWAMRSSGRYSDADGAGFFGVGISSGIASQRLAKRQAETKAKSEIAKLIEVYSASVMKEYLATAGAGSEQDVESKTQTVTSVVLRGIEIVDSWVHPDGSYYALAKITLANAKAGLLAAEEVDAGTRSFVEGNAERLFETE